MVYVYRKKIGQQIIKKKTLIKNVQNQIGNKKIICALSGGVDSSVVAQLLNKAVGKQLHCIFVNTGLLRLNEEKQVVNTFKKKLKMNLIYVNAVSYTHLTLPTNREV